jgi:DNA-binding response OmpR family regulator
MQHILIVEDNADLSFGLRNNLEIEGYTIEVADDGNKGLGRARAGSPDLIILDLMMPGLDGYRVLKTLREEGYDTPVLILSARGEEADKVRGFRLGADDYVTKPFSLLELLARVEALLRRSAVAAEKPEDEGQLLRVGKITVNIAAKLVYSDERVVQLTDREYELLLELMRNAGKVVTRQELLRRVWGHRGAVNSRTVDTHIMELRRKLQADQTKPSPITTVRKSGYRMEG